MTAPVCEVQPVALSRADWTRTAPRVDAAARIFKAWQRSGVVHGEAVARWLSEVEGGEVKS
jgi:hypothetical protein